MTVKLLILDATTSQPALAEPLEGGWSVNSRGYSCFVRVDHPRDLPEAVAASLARYDVRVYGPRAKATKRAHANL